MDMAESAILGGDGDLRVFLAEHSRKCSAFVIDTY